MFWLVYVSNFSTNRLSDHGSGFPVGGGVRKCTQKPLLQDRHRLIHTSGFPRHIEKWGSVKCGLERLIWQPHTNTLTHTHTHTHTLALRPFIQKPVNRFSFTSPPKPRTIALPKTLLRQLIKPSALGRKLGHGSVTGRFWTHPTGEEMHRKDGS